MTGGIELGLGCSWHPGAQADQSHERKAMISGEEGEQSRPTERSKDERPPERGTESHPNPGCSCPVAGPGTMSLPHLGGMPCELGHLHTEHSFTAGSSHGSLMLIPDCFYMSFLCDEVSIKSNKIWDF